MLPRVIHTIVLNESNKPIGMKTIAIMKENLDGTVVYIRKEGNGFLVGEGRFIPRGLCNEGA